MKKQGRKMSEQKHNLNFDFDCLLGQSDHHRLSKHLSDFYTRPAYYGTSQQIGGSSHGQSAKESES